MKKLTYFVILLLVVSTLVLGGCKGRGEKTGSTKAPEAEVYE